MRYISSYIKYTLILVGSVLVLWYALFQAQNVLRGPEIIINFPNNGSTLNAQLINTTGAVQNATSVILNGRNIFVDKEGSFEESLLLANGYNIIEFEATDKFGRNIKKSIEVVLKN